MLSYSPAAGDGCPITPECNHYVGEELKERISFLLFSDAERCLGCDRYVKKWTREEDAHFIKFSFRGEINAK